MMCLQEKTIRDGMVDVNQSFTVQTGLSNGTYTEIVAGLNEGDKVVVTYQETSTGGFFAIGGGPGGLGAMRSAERIIGR